MSRSITFTEIIEFLNQHNIENKVVNHDEFGFSRHIQFIVNNKKYLIEWCVEHSTLFLGEYESSPFTHFTRIIYNATSPISLNKIQFTNFHNDFPGSVWITIIPNTSKENESDKTTSDKTMTSDNKTTTPYKPKIIAVDFDGTLCKHDFPNIGEIEPKNQKVIDFVKYRKKQFNDTIILWTCREGKYLDEAIDWCVQKQIPLDYINDNCDQVKEGYGQSRKILADIYIDDKCVDLDTIPFYLNTSVDLKDCIYHSSWLEDALDNYKKSEKQSFGIDSSMTIGEFIQKYGDFHMKPIEKL